ncbi:MAG: iron-containing alcohol dehydrogenase [Actinomycetes bacterium]
MTSGFVQVEPQRTIAFGRGAVDESLDLLGEGFTLLATERAAAAVPSVTARAGTIVIVPAGLVEEVAAELRPLPAGRRIVALGGGRVVDVAKALAAADGPSDLVAIPTTLSGAEMTGWHRHLLGVTPDTPHVRPTVVINDPALSASQSPSDLAASSANAVGHAVTAVLSERSNAIASAVGAEALQRLADGWSGLEPDRDSLALGALLAGWAMDRSGASLHHAMAQTAVRTASLSHAQANAALLPVTVAAFRRRRPEELDRLDSLLGLQLESLAVDLAKRAGTSGLGAIGTDGAVRAKAVEAVLRRGEIGRISPAPDGAELDEIYLSASP